MAVLIAEDGDGTCLHMGEPTGDEVTVVSVPQAGRVGMNVLRLA